MSLLYRDNNGNETPVSGLNGLSGEVVYGASTVRTGTVTITAKETAYGTYGVTFAEPMPDDDYVVNLSISGLSGGNWHNKTFNVSYENKTKNGFVICVGKPNDTAIEAGVIVKYTAFKLFTVEGLSDLESNVTELQAVVPSGASSSNQLALASKTLSVNSSGGSLSNAFTKRIVKINFYGNNLSLEETVFILGMKKNWNTNRYYSEMYLVNISSIGLTVTKLNKTDSVHTNLISNFKLKRESSSSNNYYLEIATNNTGSNDYTFLVTPYLGRATLTPICEDVGDSEEDVYTATINRMITTSDLASTVTSGSSAPITSGGVYSALNTVSYGTATRNSATMTGSSFVGKWHKCGKLVMAEVQGNTVASEITSDVNLMTGFPKPLENVALVAQGGANTAAVGVVLKTDGALRSHYNMAASTFFHATFTYITSE